MKRLVCVFLVFSILIGAVGCSESDNEQSNIIKEDNSSVITSKEDNEISSASSNLDNAKANDAIDKETQNIYNELVKKIISEYIDNSVATNDSIQDKPEDFLFPKEIPEITFMQDEMGYFYGEINSDDNKYKMVLTIDDIIFDGQKREDTPKIISVMFNKL